jgi:hypothetical protein
MKAVDRVRKICMALPDVTEKLSHGEPTWWVNKRTFAMFDNNHHNIGHIGVWMNAPDGAQEALVAAEPQHFFRPPYVGVKGWIGVRLDSGLDWKVVASLLEQAHRVTGAKKRSR